MTTRWLTDDEPVAQLAALTEAILGRVDPEGVVMAPHRDAEGAGPTDR